MIDSARGQEDPSFEDLKVRLADVRDLGKAARLAVPRLTEYRSHPNPWVRMLAAEALKEITPEPH